jgi:hypothetical protein
MRAKRDRQASTPIALGPLALMMLVVLPAVAYGLNTGGLGPWFVAAAGTALAFVIQTHWLTEMRARHRNDALSQFFPERRRTSTAINSVRNRYEKQTKGRGFR